MRPVLEELGMVEWMDEKTAIIEHLMGQIKLRLLIKVRHPPMLTHVLRSVLSVSPLQIMVLVVIIIL